MDIKNDQIDIVDEDTQEKDFTTEELEDESIDWQAKAKELKGIAKRRATKLAKAKEKIVELSKPKEEEKLKPQDKKEEKPTIELDYSQKAFLKASGIEEFDIVLEEAKKFGGDLKDIKLEELIENPYFKQRLEQVRTEKDNAEASDIKGGRKGTLLGKDTPEYWLNKLGENEQIPADLSRELKQKIVTARRTKRKDSKMFYND